MTTSRRELVLQAIATALGAATATPAAPAGASPITKPTDLTVERNPEGEHDDGTLPRVDIYMAPETLNYEVTDGTTRVLTVRVRTEIKWDPADFGSGDEALDEFLTWNEVAILADITLGGLSREILATGLQTPAVEQRADKYAMALQSFDVTYLTKFGNPLEGY